MSRRVGAALAGAALLLLAGERGTGDEQHVSMLAMKFDYLPDTITVKRGKPVVLELSALDRQHGFYAPGLGLRVEIPPGAPTILRFTPAEAGVFNLHCDIFCGDGHDGMTGQIVVTE
jgi:cytochrome c oxidase subunit II